MRFDSLINEAEQVYSKNFNNSTWFERAIFLGWYCSLGDCEFCYMSTQKAKKPAIRSIASIMAEVLVCKQQGWKIEFLSGGYNAVGFDQLLRIVKSIKEIYDDELWLNVGVLSKKQIEQIKPYIAGINGSVECINPVIRAKVCPSKSLDYIEEMFEYCNEVGLKKSITIIIGLGETEADMPLLKKFIVKHKLDRITFYALNPHKGTPFTKGPDSIYYSRWIAYIRIHFPKLIVISGTWTNRVDEVGLLLKAGSNAITKFPAIRQFNSTEANIIHEQAKLAKRMFVGSLTVKHNINKQALPKFSFLNENEKASVAEKYLEYMRRLD